MQTFNANTPAFDRDGHDDTSGTRQARPRLLIVDDIGDNRIILARR